MDNDKRRSTDMGREELRLMMAEVAKAAAQEAVTETLLRMGLKADDPIEAQKDFQHLRQWRKSTQSLGMKATAAALTLMVSGALAALWVGLKAAAHQ